MNEIYKPHRARVTLLFAVLALIVSLCRTEARDNGYLVPVRPNFDTDAQYARVYEQMLFTGPSWTIRYFKIGEEANTGLSIDRNQDGKFWVTVKQVRAQLGFIVQQAGGNQRKLKSALAAIKVEVGRAEVPETVAMAVHRFGFHY